MFITYYSNQLEKQQAILATLLEQMPPEDPFQTETILVQSPGIAQWLQMELAKTRGIAANLSFPMPASFIWQLYADNLPAVSLQNPFDKESMQWRLMRLIPDFLEERAFQPLRHYLATSPHSEQFKLYQLSAKIADLFDQYLVYRPEWIFAWEKNEDYFIQRQIQSQQGHINDALLSQIEGNLQWQGILWRALVADVKADVGETATHRAALNQQFLDYLSHPDGVKNLPSRIFIFGISALPAGYLTVLQAISPYTDVHLFFNNPSQEYWGDISDLPPDYLRTRARRQWGAANEKQGENQPLFSAEQLNALEKGEHELTAQHEHLQVGNPLLASWGKMGRDFLYTLIRDEERIASYALNAYETMPAHSLLGQLQSQILHLENKPFKAAEKDPSLTLHSCHSAMREVEVLHDYLLALFNENGEKPRENQITPKDVVVMVADINQYAPYIQAVFGQKNEGVPTIPFSISDNKLSESDVLVASFLTLLQLKESTFRAEDVLALLDIPALREKFGILLTDLPLVREWVADAGIRFGLWKQTDGTVNFNAWQAGIERMLLGYAMREENGIWQESLGLDSSYGLKGALSGNLARFLSRLSAWYAELQQAHSIENWQQKLTALLADCFAHNESTADTLFYLQDSINAMAEKLQQVHFDAPLNAEIIADVMRLHLEDAPNSLKFLAGRVNFCTLLPMRAVPFKVVCLLGMNDADYPRVQTPNSFDLMQYHHQKGDRVRRDDDRYLFLEALLAAREACYISYVGRAITDNQEKQPSVLVSQLLDYINQDGTENLVVQQHPMTAFSPDNFKNADNFHRSFAKKWLPMAQNQTDFALNEFIVPMKNKVEEIHEIPWERFVSFVENPVKFFFEKQLGVYFRDEDDRIADHENFKLDGLVSHRLHNELVHLDESEFNDYFAKAAVKGILPRGEFGLISAQKIQQKVLEFKGKIADLGKPHSESIDLTLNVEWAGENREIRLTGYLDNLYGDEHQIIEWRFAKYKDSYRIRPWLGYLAQAATREIATPAKLVVDDRAGAISFKAVTKETALAQLSLYAQAYLASQQHIQLVPTVGKLADFMPVANEENQSAVNIEGVLKALQGLTKNDDYGSRADPYWTRILAQTNYFESTSNVLELVKKTAAWFEEMMAAPEKENQGKGKKKA